jgi:c-di-GMP-binding flagellar brake protein YcgR
MSSPWANRIERRRSPREIIGNDFVLEIEPGDGRKPLRCVIRDISEGGASLQLPENVSLTGKLHARIGNVVQPIRLIWQNQRQIGIEFLEIKQVANLADPLANP